MKHAIKSSALALFCALGATSLPAAEQGSATATMESSTQAIQNGVSDAWIDGKLEAVYGLNRYLNPLTIDTSVDDGIVMLSGTVGSDTERDLAQELARGIDGVRDVVNKLRVEPDVDAHPEATGTERSFGQWVDDSTTTAMVKSKLLANGNTKGLDIDVDTTNNVVTLSGTVSSGAQRELAAELAGNTSDVADVDNKLVVSTD